MKLGVIGSRSFTDYNLLKDELDKIKDSIGITLIISGGAAGADTLAERYARQNRIPTKIYYPDWKKLGAKAGLLRNTSIIKNSDKVVAFWDGISTGTLDSITKAKKFDVPLMIIEFSLKTKDSSVIDNVIKSKSKGRIVKL